MSLDTEFPPDETTDESPALRRIEGLLASFLRAALGLKLMSSPRVPSAPYGQTDFGPQFRGDEMNPRGLRVWETDRGTVHAYAELDAAQSRRSGTLVVFLEWWLAPGIHHAGWWRCNVKRPKDWTKGRG